MLNAYCWASTYLGTGACVLFSLSYTEVTRVEIKWGIMDFALEIRKHRGITLCKW